MGAWGYESYSNDDCFDALANGQIKGKKYRDNHLNIYKMNQKECNQAVSKTYKKLRDKTDYRDRTAFVGVVIWVLIDGKKVSKKYLTLALNMALNLFAYCEQYSSPDERAKYLKVEIKAIESALAGDGTATLERGKSLIEQFADLI